MVSWHQNKPKFLLVVLNLHNNCTYRLLNCHCTSWNRMRSNRSYWNYGSIWRFQGHGIIGDNIYWWTQKHLSSFLYFFLISSSIPVHFYTLTYFFKSVSLVVIISVHSGNVQSILATVYVLILTLIYACLLIFFNIKPFSWFHFPVGRISRSCQLNVEFQFSPIIKSHWHFTYTRERTQIWYISPRCKLHFGLHYILKRKWTNR